MEYLVILLLVIVIFLLFKDKFRFSKKTKRKSDILRILSEDALKHIYDCEYNKLHATLDSIAGNLKISNDEAAKVINRLQSLLQIEINNNVIQLSKSGKENALKIIRIHRLWERYLADETGVTEENWHAIAEEMEHKISKEEADLLASQIGNPVIDPHGDPIPTADGLMPKKKGVPMNSLCEGEFASIVHIEDEPETVFSQINAYGLHPGSEIEILDKNNNRIKFLSAGEELILAPIFASNISVEKIEKSIFNYKLRPLTSLKQGQRAVVRKISKALRGQQRRRLLDFGLVPGVEIRAELKPISGDPVAYLVRESLIAIRNKQAEMIYIEVI